MKNEKEYNKLYQRELFEKQRQIKRHCNLCNSTYISHFHRKHIVTKTHKYNVLREENNILINLLNPLNFHDSLEIMEPVEIIDLEIVDV